MKNFLRNSLHFPFAAMKYFPIEKLNVFLELKFEIFSEVHKAGRKWRTNIASE